MTDISPSPAGTVPDKSTLFCPDCGHESRYDDDWVVVETEQVTSYLCPDCGREITTRSPFTADRSRHQPLELWQSAWQTWGESVRSWQEFWREMMGVP